jgi:hypothetical protein
MTTESKSLYINMSKCICLALFLPVLPISLHTVIREKGQAYGIDTSMCMCVSA